VAIRSFGFGGCKSVVESMGSIDPDVVDGHDRPAGRTLPRDRPTILLGPTERLPVRHLALI
jgi:hypothetical protein